MTTTPNPNEEAARTRKAIALADLIDGRVVLDEDHINGLRLMPEVWWKEVAAAAKVHPPSPKTVEVVVSLLRNRLATRATLKADPFRGFPKDPSDAPRAEDVHLKGCDV